MSIYRNGNYCAFYVAEPFSPTLLGAFATRDFNYYQMLKAWKGNDFTFPFNDSHAKTYSVRDGSDWEYTLKPRLRERLRSSKNIVLFLSEYTQNSRALREEIDYGINTLGLPIIVIYPDLTDNNQIIDSNKRFTSKVSQLWARLPIFRDSMYKVPTAHIPMKKEIIRAELANEGFMVNSSQKLQAGLYYHGPRDI